MTHRFLVAASQVNGQTVSFSASQTHQLRKVLRLRGNEVVHVFDGSSSVDLVVRLTSADSGRIEGTLPHAAEPATRLVAYPALLQRDKFEQVLQKLTEVGVACVVPVLTARSVVRDLPDDRRQARWQAIIGEAVEQSNRGLVPGLAQPMAFEAAIRHAVGEGLTLVAYERETRGTLEAPLSHARDRLGDGSAAGRRLTVSMFVGPEGGYTADEVAAAEAAGAQLITLGPRILRTETASPILAALVLYQLGDLSSAHASDERS